MGVLKLHLHLHLHLPVSIDTGSIPNDGVAFRPESCFDSPWNGAMWSFGVGLGSWRCLGAQAKGCPRWAMALMDKHGLMAA